MSRVVILDDGLETISRGWDSVGRRLAGAATHTLGSLPALDDEVEPLHPPISTASHTTAASQASSAGQGPVQHSNSHCRWIRQFFLTDHLFSTSLSPRNLNTVLTAAKPLGSPMDVQNVARFCTFVHVFFPPLMIVVAFVYLLRCVRCCVTEDISGRYKDEREKRKKRPCLFMLAICFSTDRNLLTHLKKSQSVLLLVYLT